jgi:hypothetical protein
MALSSVSGAVTWTATPFNPASVPLAVRTPYLSCWLAQGSGTALNAAWPQFWTGSVCIPQGHRVSHIDHDLQTLGWAGYIKVDNTVYNFLGAPDVAGASKAVQKSFQVRSFLYGDD